MLDSKKIKISEDQFFAKLLCLGGILFSLLMLSDYRRTDGNTLTLYFISLIIFISLLLYFLVRPIISYDHKDFYIKKLNKSEITIPLKSIISIFNYPIISRDGTDLYYIEYIDKENGVEKIKFYTNRKSDRMTDFINSVKMINPDVEIV